MPEQSRLSQLRRLLEEHFADEKAKPFVPGVTRIPLIVPSYGAEEVYEALLSLLSTNVTMGEKVRIFESLFAHYIGATQAVMVNSGSSANLLALSALVNHALPRHLEPGDEVITPAVTWATTVYPIINTGLVPVLVDIDRDTLNLDPNALQRALTPRTRAVMPVHLLGNPCPMKEIQEFCRAHDLFLVEDACEAHGAEVAGKKVGSFGDLASFSFFFSHHITTIEGGMVLTSHEELGELLKALRVFGWVRDLRDRDKYAVQSPEIDPRFLFVNTGYNFRPTEIQGAFGIHQLPKLERFIAIRRENAAYWTRELQRFEQFFILPQEQPGTRHVWYGYPVTIRPGAPFTRQDLVQFLEKKSVETRPVMAGNMDEQPSMRHFTYQRVGELPNARWIMRNSFFFGDHHGIGPVEREAIVHYFEEFLRVRVKV
ncbi:MAG: aminotransferase class I/II-fold pyridoxal phosphate-dependent enzyme [Chloroflexi bacterium]|nr:aminotransferase class I/II-fold pyridoxal phosphate-dependent enzyme [Chloroflexota bacterium]